MIKIKVTQYHAKGFVKTANGIEEFDSLFPQRSDRAIRKSIAESHGVKSTNVLVSSIEKQVDVVKFDITPTQAVLALVNAGFDFDTDSATSEDDEE